MAQRNFQSRGPLGGILGLVVLVAIVYVLFKMVSGVFSILGFLAPILLIIALILNRNVVFDYVRNIINIAKKDLPKGLIYGGLSVIGWPVVSAYLFFKAFTTSKIKKAVDNRAKQRREEEQYTQYEEVEDEDDFLELPDLNEVKTKEKIKDTGYDNLFD